MNRTLATAFLLLSGIAALAFSAGTAPGRAVPQSTHAAQPPADFFPVSVWYGGGKARAPMLEPVTPESERAWREDIRKIQSLGFNTVRTWIEWTANEPRPGEYHFEQLELLLRLAEEAGLKVIVQVYVDSAPDWVGRKFPDAHFVAQNGAAIPSQAAPGFCFDHPGVRDAVLAFFREAARRAARSPAFYGWDLWSEPHIINWAIIDYIPNASFCYCPHTLGRFRAWLRRKYADLAALNAAWYRRFERWEDVEPPRFGTILSYTDYLDWRAFLTEKLAEDLRARHDAVKSVDASRVTTSHAAVPCVFTSPAAGDGTPDDWLMARAVDFYGTSLYPKHSLPATHWSLARRALAFDFARSTNGEKGFYVGELQAGFGVRGVVVGEEITPQDHDLYLWSVVARGARAVNFYAFYPMSSGYESGGYGLIELDGILTERARRAGRNARILHENAARLLASRPQPAEAALLFNRFAALVGGHQHTGERTAVRDSAAGYHRMFFERNVPLDFLSPRFLTPELLRRYKLVIVPYPIQLDAATAARLEEYVRQGGHLLAEARPGWVDDRGHAQPVIPGFGWERMFGAREKSVTPRTEFRVRLGEKEFSAATFEERFEILGPAVRVLGTFADGSPALLERAHGRGRALLLGAFAGQLNESKPTPAHPLGEFLMEWAGLERPQLRSSAPVEFQELRSPEGRFLFLLNHGSAPAQVELKRSLEKAPRRITELITGASLGPSGAAFEWKSELPPQSVRVFRLDY
jgi:beta-galactosidase